LLCDVLGRVIKSKWLKTECLGWWRERREYHAREERQKDQRSVLPSQQQIK
jgi:hypothetical protein